jgi:hypothetical protein
MARAWLSCHARKMERENGMNRGGGVELLLQVTVAKRYSECMMHWFNVRGSVVFGMEKVPYFFYEERVLYTFYDVAHVPKFSFSFSFERTLVVVGALFFSMEPGYEPTMDSSW